MLDIGLTLYNSSDYFCNHMPEELTTELRRNAERLSNA